MELEFEISGDRAFLEVAKAFTRIDRSIPRDALKAIKDEARLLSKEASAKALAEPALGTKHTGLRKRVAKGVKVQSLANGSATDFEGAPTEGNSGWQGYRIATSMPEEDEAIIPRGFDHRRGWRHPLFGNKKKWYRNYGAFSWFLETMQKSKSDLDPKMEKILEDAADHVDKSAHLG
ncbi:hypothetical protein [Nocardia sp. NPDC057440]|uniref:hypothetical protein n=1 Tax=Nocardia sp. NPDC057440 TaxID=3346134 RepID=UPI00366CB114